MSDPILDEHQKKIVGVAKICHEANRAFCETIGDFSQPPWERLAGDMQASVVNGVTFHLEAPRQVDESHENWMKYKLAHGWEYGLVKDIKAKKHPNLKPFTDLPMEEQIKDAIFLSIVIAMSPLLVRALDEAQSEESK